MNATTSYNDASKTVAVFCSIMAGIIALIFYVIQRGYLFQLEINNSQFYDSDLFFPPILSALVLSIFLLNFPQAYRIAESKFKLPFRDTWLTSDAALSLIGLIILILAGNIFSFYVLHVFYLISFSLFAYVFYSWLKGVNYKHSYIFIGISILFSIWVASLALSSNCEDVLLFEKIIFFKDIQGYKCPKDVLLNANFINMIQLHGILTTGLDGIPILSSYFGSLWILAGIIKLLATPKVISFSLATMIIFIPFMFNSLLLLAINVKKWKEGVTLADWSLRKDWKFWLIFFVACIGFVSYPYFSGNMVLLWHIDIIVFSYSFGLTFSFLLLGMLLSFIINKEVSTKEIKPVFFLFVLPFMIILIGFTKLTAVFLILAILFYLFIRLRLYRITIYNLSFIIISGIGIAFVAFSFYIAYQSMGYTASNTQSVSLFDPFNFLRTWIKPSMWLVFLFICCFWSISFITMRLWYEKGINNVSHFKTLFLNKQLIDVEIVVLLCVVGLLPGMVFHLPPYNTAYSAVTSIYFYDFQNWIALSLLLANIGKLSKLFNKKVQLILLIPVLFGGYFFVSNYIYHVNNLYSKELHLSQLIKNNPSYLSTPTGKVLLLLNQIGGDMHLSEKKKTLVFVPQSNTDFWSVQLDACYGVPFLIPGITGMPMLDGLPPIGCKPYHYGYDSYENNGIRTKKQTNTKDKALCSKALDKGFSQILRIDSIYTKPRLIFCKRIVR